MTNTQKSKHAREQRVSPATMAAIAKDIITTNDFERDIAKRHGVRHDHLTKIKKSEQWQSIYDKLLNRHLDNIEM